MSRVNRASSSLSRGGARGVRGGARGCELLRADPAFPLNRLFAGRERGCEGGERRECAVSTPLAALAIRF